MQTRKIRLFQKMKIRRQILLVYFMVAFLPIVLIGGFLLTGTNRLLNTYYSDLLKSDNLRVKTILFEITLQLYNISDSLALDKDIRKIITDNYDSDAAFMQEVSGLAVLDDYNYSYAEIDSIEIYSDNPNCRNFKQFRVADDAVKETEWYRKAIKQNSVFWIPMSSEDKYGNIYWNLYLVRKIPTAEQGYSGVLVICLSDNYLRTRIDSREYEVMISVDDGEIFYSSDRAKYGEKQPVSIDYGQNYFDYEGEITNSDGRSLAEVSTLLMYQSDSKIYICTTNREAHGNIMKIIYLCLGIVLATALAPGIMIYCFTNYFTSRILTLRQAMHQASNEDYEIVASVQGQDEISEVFYDLKVMVQKIKQKDAEMYEARLKEQELINEQQKMEFNMLFAQINPHFLYNTLETIRMKALKAGDREVATAIKLLGKSMRYVLETSGTGYILINKELEHVKNYLAIQELRFKDKFESRFMAGEDIPIDDAYILPLLLQPVVENSILHGLEEKERGGLIALSMYSEYAEKGERLFVIEVRDNGCGMDERELSELRNRIELKDMGRGKSIGLLNVNQRIKLNYGKQYGIKVESVRGKGTVVQLYLPYNIVLKNKN